mmetsp:Transcript_1816/g.2435  ORF Transcript_1816/g.2435 Transcript_1816/m.2435 type:complete len:254 (-) Transcript_1816:178-939(-)
MTPVLSALQLVSTHGGGLLGGLHLSGLFVHFEQALRTELSGMLDSGEDSSQEVALFSREGREGLDMRIKVSCQYLLDHLGTLDVLREDVRELNPIADDVVSNPEYSLVYANPTGFLRGVQGIFLSSRQDPLGHPVVGVRAHNLSKESERGGSTHFSEPLNALLDEAVELFTEANSGPLEHLRVLLEVLDDAVGVRVVELLLFSALEVGSLLEQQLHLVDEIEGLLVRNNACLLVDFIAHHGVLDLEVRQFYKG